ncbi:MAG: hypothetical protein LBL47_03225 [Lactobacillus sp.]|nr:hypothetical protein [Lactobacillus sp.]
MYTKEEVQEELDKQNWEKPELFWQNKKTSDGKYLLFRGHGVIDDTSTQHYKDENGDNTHLVHATPIFKIATSPWKFKASINYQNFPPNMAFVSVYSGSDKNKFYPDETLEAVLAGKEVDNGEKIDSITNFDDTKHFETALNAGNNKIATYLYKFTQGMDKDSVVIAKLDENSKLMEMLQTNQKQRNNNVFNSVAQNSQNTL